jgi:hypothetical protein
LAVSPTFPLRIFERAIDLSEKCNDEYKYSPENEQDEHYRQILEQSLLHKSEITMLDYLVSVAMRRDIVTI